MSAKPTPVRVGQVWQDWDSRLRRHPARLLLVLRVEEGFALLRREDTLRETRVRLDRMRPTSTGYRLVSEATK